MTAALVTGGTWVCSKLQRFLCFRLVGLQLSSSHSQGLKSWELRMRGKKKRFFLSCSRVSEFLQLPVYLKTYYRNNSFPVFIIHILSSYWLFVTTPSLLSGKLFSAGRMKMYSVSLPYSCFASWCCATPEIVIPWPVSSNVDLDLRDCVLSKIHDLKKKLYLISLAERS